MSSAFAETTFKSFDGAESVASKLYLPDRYRVLENTFAQEGAFAAQGGALSYAPLSFCKGSGTVQMTEFNRILAFDHAAGVIEVEAGLTLGDLALFTIPRGWYLKVQPGHPSITVGGCLGADVHGKNQFLDLNFKEQVRFLKLYHPATGFISCDRQTHPEIFHLTCGGFGLTGIVISLGIQLGPLVSTRIQAETIRVDDIFQLPTLLKEQSTSAELLYSWHNFQSHQNFGSGFLKTGQYEKVSPSDSVDLSQELKSLFKIKLLSAKTRARLPINLLNRYSVSVMNKAYSTKELGQAQQIIPLVDFLFPVLNKTVYFELFCKRGFHESQVLIPFDRFDDVIRSLQKAIQKHSAPVTLASCKLFKGQQELLRFIGEGIVLAFNMPRGSEAAKVLAEWDHIVMEAKCLPSISKDSRLPVEVVRACYQEYEEFKSRLHAWDSKRRFQTSTSQRLQL